MNRLDPATHSAPVLLRHLPEGPLVGAEVGVLRGVNAAALLEARPELLLYCVDNWDLGGLVEESPASIRHEAHVRLSVEVECESEFGGSTWAPYPHYRVIWQEMHSFAASLLHQASLDFVHLDSCHEQDHLTVEIEMWQHAVKPGGLLCGHDYHRDWPGVVAAVDARRDEWMDRLIVEERTWIYRTE